MRILHLITNPCLTHGGPVFEFEISKRLKQEGIYFDYLITVPASPEDEARFREQGSELYLLPWDQDHGLLVREMKVNLAYYRFFCRHRYDIVYADTENPMRAVHLLMARLAGVKVRVIHSHNTGMQTTSRLSYKIANLVKRLFPLSATHYFACSDPAAKWLFPSSVYNNKGYTMLKNGVDLKRFAYDARNRAEIRSRYGVADGELLLGHVGRFMPQKNHAMLVEIFAELLKLRPDARLMLIGDGPLQPQVEEAARTKGIFDRIIFVGTVQDVAPYLHAMDVFAMPSLFEGLPVTGVEAQAAGLKCIFSDTITSELQITELAEYLPLNAEPITWAKRICALGNAGHADASARITAAGFDIDHTAHILREFYLEHSGEAAK